MAGRGLSFTEKKNIVENLSNGNPKNNVKNVRNGEEQQLLKCTCFLPRFSKKIKKWQIDFRGWELLGKTPFGTLIKVIPELEINVEILDALLSSWDDDHCGFVIGGNIISFTADDIALIIGLPNRGNKVLRNKVGFDGGASFRRTYRTLADLEHGLDKVLQVSKSNPNSENDRLFVQLMILYLWSSVLFPNTSRTVPAYLAYYVQNLEAIGNYNWAESIHSFLVKEMKMLKKRNEGKKATRYIKGLCFAVNAWFFEHVNFGVDSRPSDLDIRPRMLKWLKVCKFWESEAFLQRFREIKEDKVSFRIASKIDDLELISLDNVKHMRSLIVGDSDNALRSDPSQVRNLETMRSDIQDGYKRTNERGRLAEEGNERRKDDYSNIKSLTEDFDKQSKDICLIKRKLGKLIRIANSKGWEIEEIDDIDDLTEQKGGKSDEKVHDVKIDGESCVEGDKGLAMEGIGQPNLQKNGKRKGLKSSIKRKHLPRKRRSDVEEEQASIPTMKNSTRFRKKDVDILVNLDDYASPIEQNKEAKVAPLNYVGRELLTEEEREYLDAFCIKPMQKDEIVFFYWNIAIRRHSMVEYIHGGYTAEEIIDAYARILYESGAMMEDTIASFLYVPPMFLGLYRNKLSSYKTFLNSVDMKALQKVKFLFLPCFISTANHWLLLVCDMEKRKWGVYDSLYDPRHREPAKEQIMLFTEYLHKDHEFDIRSWSLEYRRTYPQQESGSLDCGVFVMKFIENIIRVPRTINFRGTDAQLFRPQIAYKILCHG